MADGDDCLVSRLLSSAVAWIPVESADGSIKEAVDRGDVVLWRSSGEHRATLTPLGAERMGVELREFGAAETPRWVRRGLPTFSPKVWPEKGRTAISETAWLLFVADDRDREDDPPQATVQSPAMMMGVAIGLLKTTRTRSKKPSKKASKSRPRTQTPRGVA